MKIVKLFQYVIAVSLVFLLSQTTACKKKQDSTVETKNSGMPHKLVPGARFDKRGLDLRKRRKIGFPTRFKGVKKGQIVIEKRDGLNAQSQTKVVNIEQAKEATRLDKKAQSPDKTTKQANQAAAHTVKTAKPAADDKK